MIPTRDRKQAKRNLRPFDCHGRRARKELTTNKHRKHWIRDDHLPVLARRGSVVSEQFRDRWDLYTSWISTSVPHKTENEPYSPLARLGHPHWRRISAGKRMTWACSQEGDTSSRSNIRVIARRWERGWAARMGGNGWSLTQRHYTCSADGGFVLLFLCKIYSMRRKRNLRRTCILSLNTSGCPSYTSLGLPWRYNPGLFNDR